MSVDMREMIASAVEKGLRRYLFASNSILIRPTATTSGCPMLEVTIASGDAYNITITKARKS